MTDWIVGSCLLILLVFLIRRLFRERISSIVRYALWALVVVRLLCPVGLWDRATALSEYISPGQHNEVPARHPAVSLPDDIPDTDTKNEITELADPVIKNQVVYEKSDSTLAEVADVQKKANRLEWTDVIEVTGKGFQIVWFCGAVIGLLWTAAVNLHFYRILKKNRIQRMDRSEFALNVYESEDLQTPCLFGLIFPAVYLTPEAWKDKTTRNMVLEHEYCHYLHGDQLWALLRGICAALWWWNPLVWAAVNMMRMDCEQACDEHALHRIGEEHRFLYGEVLIQTAAKGNGKGYRLIASTMTSEKDDLKGRLCMIMKRRKNQMISVVLAGVLTVSAAVMCFGENKSSGETDVNAEDIMVSISIDMADWMAKKANKSYMDIYTADEDIQKVVEPFQEQVEGVKPAEVYLYRMDEKMLTENPAADIYPDEELITACVRAFASLSNSEKGPYTLAAASVLTDSATYLLPEGLDGVWAVKLIYPKDAVVFATFWATEHGTMEVSAQPILAEEIPDFRMYLEEGAYLYTALSCEEIPYDMKDFEAVGSEYAVQKAEVLETDNDSVIACTKELAEVIQKRASSEAYAELMDISGRIQEIVTESGERFAEEASAAIIWSMDDYDEMIETLTAQSSEGKEVIEDALSVDRLISTIPSFLLGNTGGAEKLAAAQMIRNGASYPAADDAETKMVWLIYGDPESENSMICTATFAVNDNGCITVNAVPLWPEGVISDIIEACMNPEDTEDNTEDLSEQEIIIEWMSTGSYIDLTEDK